MQKRNMVSSLPDIETSTVGEKDITKGDVTLKSEVELYIILRPDSDSHLVPKGLLARSQNELGRGQHSEVFLPLS